MPLSDMFHSDEPDGTPHPATVTRPIKDEDRPVRRAQLSGEAFGEDPEKGFDEPRPRENHDTGPDH